MRARESSDRVRNFFAANSTELTPVSARHAASVFHAPFVHDPDVTRLCAAVLSPAELRRADRFANETDQARFIQRRSFQRHCAAAARGSSRPLSRMVFQKTETGQPILAESPDIHFSFSSCRLGHLGAWSASHGIGVDIEDPARGLEATALARHYFSEAEAQLVEQANGPGRLQTFFQLWCLKEAALKSIGQGLPYGLDAFRFGLKPYLRVLGTSAEQEPRQFDVHLLTGTNGCAALVMHRLALPE